MKFSLIVATLGRDQEIERLFNSLAAQDHRDFEVILVDQNSDERLAPIVAAYRDRFPLQHLKSAPGLSRARNVGLAAITGDAVAFPDDDCVYAGGLLNSVALTFDLYPNCAGLTGRPAGDEKYWDGAPGPVNRFNVWKRGISYTIFLRRAVVARVGGFDESLGVGAGTPWGAGEESDYLLRAIAFDFHLRYDPKLAVQHPGPIAAGDARARQAERAFRYAMGTGRVLSLRKLPAWYVAYKCARPLAGMASAVMRLRWRVAQVYWAVFDGMVRGYLSPHGVEANA